MSESDKCYIKKNQTRKGDNFTSDLTPNSDGFPFKIYSEFNHFLKKKKKKEFNHFCRFHYSAQPPIYPGQNNAVDSRLAVLLYNLFFFFFFQFILNASPRVVLLKRS